MRFLHLSDLHLGKRIYDYSMIDDQKYILERILEIIDQYDVDGILFAGDIYDKSVPVTEAVTLFDDFISKINIKKKKIFIISGNHDSAERLSVYSRILAGSGIYMSDVYRGKIQKVTLYDEYGKINVFLIPFIKPVHVRKYFPDQEMKTYTDMMKFVIDSTDIDENERNICMCHQFVTGAKRSDSEEISIGGLDNIDGYVFSPFDYTALGHIHSPQNISADSTVRYCGSPLKYSFSEKDNKKTATLLTFKEKGNTDIEYIDLVPVRDMREIKGTFEEISDRSFYEKQKRDDYLHIVLTDEEEIIDAKNKLSNIYQNIMLLEYDNTRTRYGGSIGEGADVENKSPLELFASFFEERNGKALSDKQYEFMKNMIEEVWGKS